MHSNIFQISVNPIEQDEFLTSSYFDTISEYADFADYVGNEYEGEERLEKIRFIADYFKDIFDIDGGVLIFKGLGTFLADWANAIKETANALNEENIIKGTNLYHLTRLTQQTHYEIHSRFYVENWNNCAGDFGDFIDYLARLEKGTRLYVGGVIDFHF